MNLEHREDEGLSLIDLLIVLAKSKRLIIGLPMIVAVVASVVVLIIPPTYKSTARILPPVIGQSSTLAVLGGMGGGILGVGKNPSDIYLAILKSNSVEDSVIKHFDLKQYYDKKYVEDTRKAFEKDMEAKAGKEGVIEITYENKDKMKAAEVANGMVSALQEVNSRLAITEAARRRLYFEKQMALAKANLADAENGLKHFQQNTGLIELQGQSGATLGAMATLEATIAAKEVQLSGMKFYATKNNPDYMRVSGELAELKAQLSALNAKGGKGVSLAKESIPEVGLDFTHKVHDVKYYETLFDIMARQFEAAKADEAKDGTLIQILDRAEPAEKRAWPKRTMTVLLSAVIALFVAILLAFVRNAISVGASDPRQAARMAELKSALWR